MQPTPYVASLRIYEPVDSFEVQDQARWSQITFEAKTHAEEQKRALIRIITCELQNFKTDGAHVLAHHGKLYVSPWSTMTRCWAALDAFKLTLPQSVVGYFIPIAVEKSIREQTKIIEDKVSHILTSNWSIPPRWFAIFHPEERLRGQSGDSPFTIVRTSIAKAKTRALFTHEAVFSAFGQGPVEAEISELIAWMEIFDKDSIVELDYGGLAFYLDRVLSCNGEGGIAADTSIEDVNTSVAGLASGDAVLAGRGYELLVSRWRRVASFESAN